MFSVVSWQPQAPCFAAMGLRCPWRYYAKVCLIGSTQAQSSSARVVDCLRPASPNMPLTLVSQCHWLANRLCVDVEDCAIGAEEGHRRLKAGAKKGEQFQTSPTLRWSSSLVLLLGSAD